MAICFIDGCDHYGTKADIEGKYDVVDGSTQIAPFNTGGRFGGGYIGISADDTAIRKNLLVPAATTFFQGYFFFGDSDTFGTDFLIVTYDSAIGAQCWLRVVNSGGTVEVRTTAGVIGTSTETLTKGQWLFFQLKMVISNTVGEVNFTVDGVNFLNLTNVDTQSTGNADVGRYAFYCPGTSSIDCRWDDIVLMDDTTTMNTELFANHRIQTLYPNGDGFANDFTGVGAGTTNADRVDDGDAGSDGDTTYLETSTLNDEDLWEFEDLDSSDVGLIKSLQITNYMRKDGVDSITATNILKLSTFFLIFETDDFLPSSSYTAKTNPAPANPFSGLQWTIDEVNNVIQFGVKLRAASATTPLRVTQASMEVVYGIAQNIDTIPQQFVYNGVTVSLQAPTFIDTIPQQLIYNGVNTGIQLTQAFRITATHFMGF